MARQNRSKKKSNANTDKHTTSMNTVRKTNGPPHTLYKHHSGSHHEDDHHHDDNSDGDSPSECPLCLEEFDMTDKNFRPCKCGYQICLWCLNRLMETSGGKAKCPNCRRPYDQKNFDFKPLDEEEIKAEQSKHKKKPTHRSRKALSNVRVIQRNLVYVVGLTLNVANEEFLGSKENFAKFGKITKLVVNKSNLQKAAASGREPTVSAYITYERKEDAKRAIQAVDSTWIDGKLLRASYGTTKYCAYFLRNIPCTNSECMYLHEFGQEDDTFSKDDIILRNGLPTPQNRNGRPDPYSALREANDISKHMWNYPRSNAPPKTFRSRSNSTGEYPGGDSESENDRHSYEQPYHRSSNANTDQSSSFWDAPAAEGSEYEGYENTNYASAGDDLGSEDNDWGENVPTLKTTHQSEDVVTRSSPLDTPNTPRTDGHPQQSHTTSPQGNSWGIVPQTPTVNTNTFQSDSILPSSARWGAQFDSSSEPSLSDLSSKNMSKFGKKKKEKQSKKAKQQEKPKGKIRHDTIESLNESSISNAKPLHLLNQDDTPSGFSNSSPSLVGDTPNDYSGISNKSPLDTNSNNFPFGKPFGQSVNEQQQHTMEHYFSQSPESRTLPWEQPSAQNTPMQSRFAFSSMPSSNQMPSEQKSKFISSPKDSSIPFSQPSLHENQNQNSSRFAPFFSQSHEQLQQSFRSLLPNVNINFAFPQPNISSQRTQSQSPSMSGGENNTSLSGVPSSWEDTQQRSSFLQSGEQPHAQSHPQQSHNQPQNIHAAFTGGVWQQQNQFSAKW